MKIKANEITKYLELHGVDKIPVEVVTTEIPECKELRQGKRSLAKRLIVTSARSGKFGGYGYGPNKKEGLDAVRLKYVMYNSFKKSECYVPPEWEFDVLTDEKGQKILSEYADHGNNLEKKFREAYAKYNPEIQAKMNEAGKLIAEAEKISEEHGIPFSTNLMSDTGYMPASFESIYSELLQDDESSEAIHELTGMYNTEYTGWQNSSTSC